MSQELWKTAKDLQQPRKCPIQNEPASKLEQGSVPLAWWLWLWAGSCQILLPPQTRGSRADYWHIVVRATLTRLGKYLRGCFTNPGTQAGKLWTLLGKADTHRRLGSGIRGDAGVRLTGKLGYSKAVQWGVRAGFQKPCTGQGKMHAQDSPETTLKFTSG